MGHNCCCVVNCKNNGKNSNCKFYSFPTAPWKLDQRNKWIAAVKRKNADGSPWSPKRHDTICSEHFIGGNKSEVETSLSYVPTIFPKVQRKKVNNSQLLAALLASPSWSAQIKQRTKKIPDTSFSQVITVKNNLNLPQPLVVTKKIPDTSSSEVIIVKNEFYQPQPLVVTKKIPDTNSSEVIIVKNEYNQPQPLVVTKKIPDTNSSEVIIVKNEFNETQPLVDQECQVNIFSESNSRETTFICNTFIYSDHCDVQMQVSIASLETAMTHNSRKKGKCCCTDRKSYVDQSTETENQELVGVKCEQILGIKSEQILGL